MKANEAPDKIWMDLGWIPHFDCKDCITEDSVEYTRTDAFIEKAADYIKKDMLDNLAFQGRLNRIEIIDGIIEKFIKAMKDE
jgi:hypothetical protein